MRANFVQMCAAWTRLKFCAIRQSKRTKLMVVQLYFAIHISNCDRRICDSHGIMQDFHKLQLCGRNFSEMVAWAPEKWNSAFRQAPVDLRIPLHFKKIRCKSSKIPSNWNPTGGLMMWRCRAICSSTFFEAPCSNIRMVKKLMKMLLSMFHTKYEPIAFSSRITLYFLLFGQFYIPWRAFRKFLLHTFPLCLIFNFNQ